MIQLSFDEILDRVFGKTKPRLNLTEKPLRLIELFGGIGSQAKALENIGVPFESWKYCDFDKFATASYNAIHGTNYEPSDITKLSADDLEIVDTDTYTYLLTYSFPCQDLSIARHRAGMSKGSGTRSSLLWEVERILTECKELPQVLLMENVPQVVGKKNKKDFDDWCKFLESKGYTNKWQLLNAKDYGIPQNRNRCFMLSWLGDYSYEFPEPRELDKCLIDFLEDEPVAEKFYINGEAADNLINELDENGTLAEIDKQYDDHFFPKA